MRTSSVADLLLRGLVACASCSTSKADRIGRLNPIGTTAMSDGFSTFPLETLQFLAGIDAENDKGWFEENRDLYEAGYVEPARRFVESMGPRLKKLSSGVKYEAKVNGSIGRINRDVRFSRDKRPYKNHLDIWFWHGEKKGWDRPGFYLRVTPWSIYIGSGMHMLEGELLERFRKAVVAEKSGHDLSKAIEQVRKAGPYEIGGATRKSVPRGYDARHERAGLLLHEGLYAGLELPAAEATKPSFTDRALSHFAATWPIGDWLLAEVTQ
jgi:uncharacterized protein (TIGR02453 family)